jgi:flagellar basal body-associated protein FliL
MKSCLGILLVFFTFVAVVGGGAFIWYLSSTAEFSRKTATPPAAPKASAVIPKARPVR